MASYSFRCCRAARYFVIPRVPSRPANAGGRDDEESLAKECSRYRPASQREVFPAKDSSLRFASFRMTSWLTACPEPVEGLTASLTLTLHQALRKLTVITPPATIRRVLGADFWASIYLCIGNGAPWRRRARRESQEE